LLICCRAGFSAQRGRAEIVIFQFADIKFLKKSLEMQELQAIFFDCKGRFFYLRQYNPNYDVGAVAKGEPQHYAISTQIA